MTPNTHQPSPADPVRAQADAPALHDRVCIPDGREGEVIGFYRRAAESVLVRLQSGESVEAFVTDVKQPR
jgi:hypothetical protein